MTEPAPVAPIPPLPPSPAQLKDLVDQALAGSAAAQAEVKRLSDENVAIKKQLEALTTKPAPPAAPAAPKKSGGLLPWVGILLAALLAGCNLTGITQEPSGWHERLGIEAGAQVHPTVERLGLPMKERWYNPRARASYWKPEEITADFNGWAWWARRGTGVGVRFERGRAVEYAYGFNHWTEPVDLDL